MTWPRVVTLSGPDSVDSTARTIADVITGHGLGFAEQHASVDALDAAMADRDRLPSDIEVNTATVTFVGKMCRETPADGNGHLVLNDGMVEEE